MAAGLSPVGLLPARSATSAPHPTTRVHVRSAARAIWHNRPVLSKVRKFGAANAVPRSPSVACRAQPKGYKGPSGWLRFKWDVEDYLNNRRQQARELKRIMLKSPLVLAASRAFQPLQKLWQDVVRPRMQYQVYLYTYYVMYKEEEKAVWQVRSQKHRDFVEKIIQYLYFFFITLGFQLITPLSFLLAFLLPTLFGLLLWVDWQASPVLHGTALGLALKALSGLPPCWFWTGVW